MAVEERCYGDFGTAQCRGDGFEGEGFGGFGVEEGFGGGGEAVDEGGLWERIVSEGRESEMKLLSWELKQFTVVDRECGVMRGN